MAMRLAGRGVRLAVRALIDSVTMECGGWWSAGRLASTRQITEHRPRSERHRVPRVPHVLVNLCSETVSLLRVPQYGWPKVPAGFRLLKREPRCLGLPPL